MTLSWFRRHTLGTALLLSLLAHLALMWDGELNLADLLERDDPDEVLARKKAKEVPKVKLNLKTPPRPAAAAGVPRVTLSFEQPAPPPAAALPPPKPKPKPRVAAQATPKPVTSTVPDSLAAETPAPSPDTPVTPAAEAPSVAAPAPARPVPPPLPAPKAEPPPAFPAELVAIYRTSVEGIRANVQHVWRMEGYQYSIENTSSFVGFKFRMATEGEITPDGTLKPANYRLSMNKKLLRFADFDYATGTLSYGKPDRPRTVRITENIYDHLSMAYQVAVSFTGEPMTLYFTTGASFSMVDLTLSGEEMLKLPGGPLKTLHVQGKSRDSTPFEVDIWLAPEQRNFPAKIRIIRKSESVELSLKSLSFEGEMRYGKNVKVTAEDEESSVPQEWLDRPDFKDYKPAEPVGGMPGEDSP